MRTTLVALSVAAGIGLICCQSAGAVPTNPAAVKEAAAAASAVEQTHYIHHGRYGFVKCYRELVFGPYRCHRFPL